MPPKTQPKNAKNDKTDQSKTGKSSSTSTSVHNGTGSKTSALKAVNKKAAQENTGSNDSSDYLYMPNQEFQDKENQWLDQLNQLIKKKKLKDESDRFSNNLLRLYDALLEELSLRCKVPFKPVFHEQDTDTHNGSENAAKTTSRVEQTDKHMLDKLAESSAKINELDKENKKLNKELESSRIELKKLMTDNDSIKDENVKLRKETENVKKKQQENENNIKVTSATTTNMIDNSEALKQKLTDQEEYLKQRSKEIEQLETLNSSLSKEVVDLKNRNKEWENTLKTMQTEFDAKLDKEIKTRSILESQNEDLKKEALKAKHDQLESKIKNQVVTNEQITRLTGENESLKGKEKELKETISKIIEDEKKLQNDIKVLTEKNTGLEHIVHEIKTQLEEEKNKLKKEKKSATKGPEQKLKDLEEENEKLRDRLSQIAGSKLTDGNPAIADLGDPNRPTQLGEKFSELYDNEWTDAMEELTNAGDEKANISTLRSIVEKSYEFGKTRAADYVKGLEEALLKINNSIQVTPEISKLLKEHRKNIAVIVADSLHHTFLSSYTEYKVGGEGVKKFIRKTVTLCWLMAIQDPPVILTTKMSGKFDTDRFRHYTKSGSTVDYVVWPVVFLHEGGPIICKGVAQGK